MPEVDEADLEAVLDDVLDSAPTSDDPDIGAAYRAGKHDGATEYDRRLRERLDLE